MPYVRQGGAWVDVLNTAPAGGSAADLYISRLLPEGVDTSSSVRLTSSATASATPHTAGAWTEIDASLSEDASAVGYQLSTVTAASATNSSTLMDIGVGAAGFETVWATVSIGYSSAAYRHQIPGFIAAGTRVSFRIRSAIASLNVQPRFYFAAAKATTFGAPVTYQADTATSRGLALAVPGSTNTKGAWTEMVASTATDLAALHATVQANGSTAMGTGGVLVDIGTGPPGSETVIIPDLYYLGATTENYQALSPTTYGVDIPAGTRIAARYARSHTGNPVDLILVGAPPA